MNSFINYFSKKIIIIFLLILSAIISSIFAFAPYCNYWLMPICLFGLFSILFNDKFRLSSFKLAYLWGICYFFLHNYWIKITLNEIVGFNVFLSLFIVLLFSIYLAIYPAITIFIVNKFNVSNFIKLIILTPALWTIMEYFRSKLLTGYSWGEVGYSQVGSILSGYVPLGGIHLLTYIIVLISCLVVYLFFFIKKGLIRFIIICFITLIYLLGNSLLKIDFTIPTNNFSIVSAVQGNIPQNLKFSYIDDSINLYLNQISLYPKVDIIIFPETAIPIVFNEKNNYPLDSFRKESTINNTALIIGIIKKLDNRFLNSAVVINPNNKNLFFYSKNHLVPFGEYRPFYSVLKKFYDNLNIPLNDLLKGGVKQKPISVANQKVAINICYEDGFGDELINLAKESTLLVNISNMGWYGKSNAMDLQLQQSQARSLELGRMLVRSTNNGRTAVISNKGVILSILPRDVMQVLIYKIQGFSGNTPFMKMGGSKILVLMLSIVVLFVWLINYFKKVFINLTS